MLYIIAAKISFFTVHSIRNLDDAKVFVPYGFPCTSAMATREVVSRLAEESM